jgi:glycine/D-amino acid oxidase-like deaminating enzyme
LADEEIETVIVGGGQAGLAMSYHLGQLGREHLVLERQRIAERWRSERWDSLTFQFPNWSMELPGFAYRGADPEGFAPRDEVVRLSRTTPRSSARRCGAGFRCSRFGENQVRSASSLPRIAEQSARRMW